MLSGRFRRFLRMGFIRVRISYLNVNQRGQENEDGQKEPVTREWHVSVHAPAGGLGERVSSQRNNSLYNVKSINHRVVKTVLAKRRRPRLTSAHVFIGNSVGDVFAVYT